MGDSGRIEEVEREGRKGVKGVRLRGLEREM